MTGVGPFHELILDGRKRQTIREFRKDGRDHVKVGMTTKLYWRVRKKREEKEEAGEPHLLGYAEITEYETVYLYEMWHDQTNALRDGFRDINEFRDWFYPVWSWHTGWMKRGGDGLVPDHEALVAHFKEYDYIFTYKRIKWNYPLRV